MSMCILEENKHSTLVTLMVDIQSRMMKGCHILDEVEVRNGLPLDRNRGYVLEIQQPYDYCAM